MRENDLTTYYAMRGQIKTGDLISWHGRSFLSRIIRWKSGYSATHTSLVFNEFSVDVTRRYVLEALSGGIEMSLLSDRLENYSGKVYWLQTKEEFRKDEILGRLAKWSLSQLGVPYDYGSLVKQLIGRVSPDARRFFCSEFAYLAWVIGLDDDLDWDKAPVPGEMEKLGIWRKPVLLLGGDR